MFSLSLNPVLKEKRKYMWCYTISFEVFSQLSTIITSALVAHLLSTKTSIPLSLFYQGKTTCKENVKVYLAKNVQIWWRKRGDEKKKGREKLNLTRSKLLNVRSDSM